MCAMGCAGVLLTGGASRRMGADKASIRLRPGGPTLAERTAALLEAATTASVEVGPGRSGLRVVTEATPRSGPLAAAVAGWAALGADGWGGPVLVVATDLPNLSGGLLRWLATHCSSRSVVPVAGGRVQPLCARYSQADMRVAAELVAAGRRAMRDLLQETEPLLASEAAWAGAAGGSHALADVDTPLDLEQVVPGRGRL